MNIKTGVKLHNRFDIEVKNKKTGHIRQIGYAENIVLNRMFHQLCNREPFFTGINFGAGTGTLDPSRTRLFNHLGYKESTIVESLIDYPIIKLTRKCILDSEEYVGKSITEVGVSNKAYDINTHALIKDAQGNPLSIDKTDIDIVTIYATVFTEFEDYNKNYYFLRNIDSNFLKYFAEGGTNYYQGDIYVSSSKLPYCVDTYNASGGWTLDIENRKIISSTKLLYNQGNKDIRSIRLSDVAHIELPCPPFFEKFSIQDEVIGIGNNVEDTFQIPKCEANNIVVKVDGQILKNYEIIESAECITEGSKNYFLTFSPDGEYLFTAANRGRESIYLRVYKKIKDGLYNLFSKDEAYHPKLDFMPVIGFDPKDMYFSPNGKYLFLGQEYKPIHIYKKTNGKYEKINTPPEFPKHNPTPYSGSLIEIKGDYLVYTGGKNLYIYKEENDSFTKIYEECLEYTITSISISADQFLFATTGYYNKGEQIALYKLLDGTVTKCPIKKPEDFSSNTKVYSSTFSPDGNDLYFGIEKSAIYHYKKEGDTFVFNRLYAFEDSIGLIRNMIISNDGKYLILVTQKTPFAMFFKITPKGLYKLSDPDFYNLNILDSWYVKQIPNSDKFMISGNGSGSGEVWSAICTLYPKYFIKFLTPPAENSMITASYDVPYIPKTEDYEINLGFELQFGEGV